MTRKFKINSIEGKRRSHSILTDLIPFIGGLMESTGLRKQDIGAGRIIGYNFYPPEPIEVRKMECDGLRHQMQIRAYGADYYQTLFLMAHKDRFPDIMNYINHYCSQKR